MKKTEVNEAVLKKMKIKAGASLAVFNLPEGVSVKKPFPPSDGHDAVLAFFDSKKEFVAGMKKLKKTILKSGSIWAFYKKGNVTDLNRDLIHELAPDFGMEAVSLISLDDVWSSMRVMFPKGSR